VWRGCLFGTHHPASVGSRIVRNLAHQSSTALTATRVAEYQSDATEVVWRVVVSMMDGLLRKGGGVEESTTAEPQLSKYFYRVWFPKYTPVAWNIRTLYLLDLVTDGRTPQRRYAKPTLLVSIVTADTMPGEDTPSQTPSELRFACTALHRHRSQG
jgi:hypothetical protein